ncbi:MAG: hypothetical protein WCG91_02340 [Candidatus Shapirobacteria bacterium]
MSADLNLLPSRAKFQAAKIKLKKTIMSFVWIFVFTWVALLTVVLAIFFISKFSLDLTSKKYTSEQNQYKALADDVSISYQIKYRAKLVGKVLKDRFEYGNSITKIYNIFSADVLINNYEIKGEKTFSVNGKVLDGANLDEVEEKEREINRGDSEDFVSAKLISIKMNPDKSWNFAMEVKLK